jgi:hypothetical protein
MPYAKLSSYGTKNSLNGDELIVGLANGSNINLSLSALRAFLDLATNIDFGGAIVPTDTPPPTGDYFWVASKNGTYTNFGGVVIPVNSIGVISRVGGVYKSSITNLAFPTARLNSLKALVYKIGDSVLTFDKTTKIISSTGFMYIFNGSFNVTASYLRLTAGSLDLTAELAAYPSSDYFFIYAKPASSFMEGTGSTAVAIDISTLIVKSFNNPTVADIRDDNAILIFEYNRKLNSIRSPFLNDLIYDFMNTTVPNINKRLLGVKSLLYQMGSANVTFNNTTKTLTTDASLYVFSGGYGSGGSFFRVDAGTLDLTAAIAAFPAANFFYIYAKPNQNFLDGTGQYSSNMSALLVKAFSDPTVSDVRSDNSIVLFGYNKLAGTITSRFFEDKLLGLINAPAPLTEAGVKTQLKLHFTHRGSFSLNQATKVLTWSAEIYIFNRGKVGAGQAGYLRINAGSFDFKTYATASTDEFFVAYLKMTTTAQVNFVNGLGGSVLIPTSDIIYKSWNDLGVEEVRENNCIVLFYYNKTTGLLTSPLFREDVDTAFLSGSAGQATNSAWTNRYPNVYQYMKPFLTRYGYGIGGNGETKNRIILWGDSILARWQHTSVLDVIPASSPPTLITKNIGAYLWENIKGSKPTYKRYDTAATFTEVGTWATAEDLANWDDEGSISTLTRRSTDSAASLSFSIDSTTNFFNLIDRKDSQGHQNLLIAIPGGNGLVQVRIEGSATWNEANGYSYSQRAAAANNPLGIGNTQYQRRVEFKKVGAGINTAQTITITKGTVNTDAFMYWGLELVNGDKPYTQMINVSRGGHTLLELRKYVKTDVYDRKPNLVVLEIPLINMMNSFSTVDYIVNEIHDTMWGDRVGFVNANSLKAMSNDWADFQVLLVIPHHAQSQFNPDNTFVVRSGGYTSEELHNAAKGFIYSRGDVGFVDMATAMMAEAKADPLFAGDYYSAFTNSGILGTGYLNDAIHPNNKGAYVYGRNLGPIFWMTTG